MTAYNEWDNAAAAVQIFGRYLDTLVWPDLAKFHHFGKSLQIFDRLFIIRQNGEPT